MRLIKKYEFIFLFLIVLAFNVDGASLNNCYISTTESCVSATPLFKISGTSNAHAGTIGDSDYGFLVCCSGLNLMTSCSNQYQNAGVLSLSGTNNAHVEEYNGLNNLPEDYPEDVCLSTSDGSNVDCDYVNDCATLGSSYKCVATISGSSETIEQCGTEVTSCNRFAGSVDFYIEEEVQCGKDMDTRCTAECNNQYEPYTCSGVDLQNCGGATDVTLYWSGDCDSAEPYGNMYHVTCGCSASGTYYNEIIEEVPGDSGPPYTNSHVAECGKSYSYDTEVCCKVDSSPPPQDCVLESASISANCGTDGVCSQGESITMTGHLSGPCQILSYFQIDAFGEAALQGRRCSLGFNVPPNDIQGIGASVSGLVQNGGYSISETWVIPAIASDCAGQEIIAGTARVYSGGNPNTGNLEESISATGGFTFAGGGAPPVECSDTLDNDNNGCADYSGGDTGCISPNDIDESGGNCGTPTQCTLTNAYWADSSGNEYTDNYEVANNTAVLIVVKGNNCNGQTVTLNYWEDDGFWGDDPIPSDILATLPTSMIFPLVGGIVQASWNAQYFEDSDGSDDEPEYMFRATYSGSNKESDRLKVNETQSQNPIDECIALNCVSDKECCLVSGVLECVDVGTCNDNPINNCEQSGGECCDAGQICLTSWISSNGCSNCCTTGCITQTGPDTGRRRSWTDCIDEDGDGIGEQNQTSWSINLTTGQDIPGTTETTGPFECTLIGASVPFFTLGSLVAVLLLLIGYYVYNRKKSLF